MSCAKSKLTIPLMSVVLLITERSLGGDHTVFPCAWESGVRPALGMGNRRADRRGGYVAFSLGTCAAC